MGRSTEALTFQPTLFEETEFCKTKEPENVVALMAQSLFFFSFLACFFSYKSKQHNDTNLMVHHETPNIQEKIL